MDRDAKTIMVAFINGLQSGELYKELAKKLPGNVKEMLDQVYEFAKGNAANRLKKESKKPNDDKRRKDQQK